jgi:hypothetical protein
VRNNVVRLSSGATICIEKTIKIHVFQSSSAKKQASCFSSQKAGQRDRAAGFKKNIRRISEVMKIGREQPRGRCNHILRKFGEPPKIRRSPLGCEPELLDAGFECRWLNVKKRGSPIGSTYTPIALFDGLQNNRARGFIE